MLERQGFIQSYQLGVETTLSQIYAKLTFAYNGIVLEKLHYSVMRINTLANSLFKIQMFKFGKEKKIVLSNLFSFLYIFKTP